MQKLKDGRDLDALGKEKKKKKTPVGLGKSELKNQQGA